MRKRLFAFIISIFFISVSSYAQPIVFGIKGGLDFTKLTGQSFSGSYATSFNAGFYATSKFNKKWGWQTEVVYNSGLENINTTGFTSVYTSSETSINVSSNASIGAVAVP